MMSFFSPEMLMTTKVRSPSASSAVPWNMTLPSTTEPGNGLVTVTEGLCPRTEGLAMEERGTASATASKMRIHRLKVSCPATPLELVTT